MAFQLLIDGVDFTCNVFKQSVLISESPKVNGATMTGKIQLSGALTRPVGGQLVQFYNGTRLEFAGRVSTVDEDDEHGPLNLQFTMECVDFTPDLDRHLLQAEYEEQPISEIAHALIGTVGMGFTSINVDPGPVIAPQIADLVQPSSFLTQIAESVEHQWYIDYERDLNLFYILNRPAPVTFIDFDTNVDDYGDLMIQEDVSQVKNVIFLTGAKVKSQVNDAIIAVADGDTRFWPLNYAPWSLEDTTVTVDSIPVTLRLDTVDGQAGDGGTESGVAYLCLDNWGIRFPDNSPPGVDSDIGISYKYEYDSSVRVENLDSIDLMREREDVAGAPSDGVHEAKFEIPELRVESEQVIVDYGNLLLTRYAFPNYVLTFESLTQGWFRGQNFEAQSTRRSFPRQTVYITQISKTLYEVSGVSGEFRMKYKITATTSPFPA